MHLTFKSHFLGFNDRILSLSSPSFKLYPQKVIGYLNVIVALNVYEKLTIVHSGGTFYNNYFGWFYYELYCYSTWPSNLLLAL